ncbi:MAG: alpha/beta hydrolase-fold protein [Elusimicrobiota bacterium]
MKGRLQIETVGSVVLKGNPLGDPRLRQLPVYLPPSYGAKRGMRYPVLYYLAGFTGGGRTVINHHPWKENLAERVDRLIASGHLRECVLVIPDCFTAYGGSQYLNSTATGRYEDHVVEELVPFIEDKFAVSREAAGRALIGKSSGGYGALMLGMRHPDVFGHIVSHSGDMSFEVTCEGSAARFCAFLEKYGASVERFTKEFLASRDKESYDHEAVNMIAMSACYAPNPKSPLGFDLLCDPRTGERRLAVWKRWLANDPIVAAPRHRAGLKKLKSLFFDCGTKDEYYLHLGARKLSQVLKGLGVAHVYQEHGFGHGNMASRYDVSLKYLSSRLK